jgi:hypothetical protein
MITKISKLAGILDNPDLAKTSKGWFFIATLSKSNRSVLAIKKEDLLNTDPSEIRDIFEREASKRGLKIFHVVIQIADLNFPYYYAEILSPEDIKSDKKI